MVHDLSIIHRLNNEALAGHEPGRCKVVQREHHGVEVSIQERHLDEIRSGRKISLCRQQCKFFRPGESDNCEIAQRVFEQCNELHVMTPVIECPKYERSD